MLTRSQSNKLKRAHDATSSPPPQTRLSAESQEQTHSQTSAQPKTPRRKAKRVRLSDPGPSTSKASGWTNDTGLTPAISRTSINASEFAPEPPTPSRRRSAPGRQETILIDPVFAEDDNNDAPIVIQFTPLRQKLDKRARRRISRAGLSDHMNLIKQEDRDLKKAQAEIALLKQELEAKEAAQNNVSAQVEQFDTMPVEDSTMSEDIVVSDSPIIRHRAISFSPAITDPFVDHVITDQNIVEEGDVVPHDQASGEPQRSSADGEDAIQQKENLFRNWQRLKNSELGAAICSLLSKVPETADELMALGVPIMEGIFQNFYDAMKSLEETRVSLSNMGFSGATVEEFIYNIHEAFFSAHTYLRSVVPEGELAEPSNCKETLETLVKRLQQITDCAHALKRRMDMATHGFNAMKQQYENARRTIQERTAQAEELQKKVASLTEYKDSSVQDMLHNRVVVVRMESEIREKDLAIERFKSSLAKYHEESREYQATIEKLETELNTRVEQYQLQIADLETKLNARQEDFCRKFEKNLSAIIRQQFEDESQVQIQSLEDQIAKLTSERDDTLKEVQERAHELDELSRLLERSEESAHQLLRANESLTELVESQAQEFENLASAYEDAVPDERKEDILRRQRRVEERFNEWVTNHRAIMSRLSRTDGNLRSEPSTPYELNEPDQNGHAPGSSDSTLSATSEPELPTVWPETSPTTPSRRRAFGNIRVGRGKDHRTLDSGLGNSSGFRVRQYGSLDSPLARRALFGTEGNFSSGLQSSPTIRRLFGEVNSAGDCPSGRASNP